MKPNDSHEVFSYLKKIEIFSEIDHATMHKICQLLNEVDFETDENIFKKGDESSSIFILVKGRVRIHDDDHIFKVLSAPNFFGEYALMDTDSRSTSVTAITNTKCLELKRDDLFNLIDTRAQITKGIVKTLTHRLRQNNELVAELVEINNQVKQHKDQILHEKAIVKEQRNQLEIQNALIESQKKEITDSINYAKYIQQAVMPSVDQLKNMLNDHFILFRPVHVVSGDFYWAARVNEWVVFSVADCTGHGVPGALMSMLGISFLNEIVRNKEITKAGEVLDNLRGSIIEGLQQTGRNDEQQDGMDIIFCTLNTQTNLLQYSGANNPLYIVNAQRELIETEADKQPVGIYPTMKAFTNHEIQMHPGDCIYLVSDGYEDQIGGSNNKKITSRLLKELFVAHSEKPMKEQLSILNQTFENWLNCEGRKFEQMDDVTIMGIRI